MHKVMRALYRVIGSLNFSCLSGPFNKSAYMFASRCAFYVQTAPNTAGASIIGGKCIGIRVLFQG
jgi:fructose-specific phosphotransferase system IIC component